jgi:murein L,D-transpeptidase YcbB/YkuD
MNECWKIPLRRLRFALVLFTAFLAAVAAARSQALTPAGAAVLHAIADSARNSDLRWPDFTPQKLEFSTFYQNSGYALAWVQGHQPRPQALAVIGLLKSADAKGLDADDYDASRWDARLAKLGQSPTEQDLVLFDTTLTVSAMRYIQAVHVGRVNPKVFNFQLDVDSGPDDLADFLQTHVLHAGDPAAEIQKLEPSYPGYKKLLALLPVYAAMAAKDDGGKSRCRQRLSRRASPMPAWRVSPGSCKSSGTFRPARRCRRILRSTKARWSTA